VVQALPDVLDGLQLVKPRPSRVPTLGPLEHPRRLRFITEIWGSTVSCKLLQADAMHAITTSARSNWQENAQASRVTLAHRMTWHGMASTRAWLPENCSLVWFGQVAIVTSNV
jgi:hypothetical protein